MSLETDDIKIARDEIQAIIENIKIVYKEFQDTLITKGHEVSYFFDEFIRHGYELIDFLTDEKIEELFKIEVKI